MTRFQITIDGTPYGEPFAHWGDAYATLRDLAGPYALDSLNPPTYKIERIQLT